MNSSSEMICQMAGQLANSSAYKNVLLLKTFLSLCAAAGTLLCAKLEGVRWLVHPNAKAIFSFHLILAVYVPLSYCIPFVFDLIRLSKHNSNPCAYTISTSTSVLIRLIPVVGLVAQSYTTCALSIERSISTIYAKSYEKIRIPTLGVALSILAIVISCCENYFLIVRQADFNAIQFITTIRTKENADYYQIQLFIFMSVEFVTIIVLGITLYKNHKLSKLTISVSNKLGGKYQAKESRHIIITLLPCFAVHFILNLWSTLGISTWQKFYGSYDPIDNAVCIEYMSHGHMYSLIMPIFIVYRLKKRRNCVVVDEYSNMDSHFMQLATYW